MKIAGIIPARYQSSRFPGKPLVNIDGKSMIQRVYEQCQKSKHLTEIIVATDDQRIFDHVLSFGGKVVFTDESHSSGTERCAEAAKDLDIDVVINIQGDEPFISPKQIDLLAELFFDDDIELATLIKVIEDNETLNNHNTPKVLVNSSNEAIYFSRQTVPFLRNHPKEKWLDHHTFYKHIGIYAYRKETLNQIVLLEEGMLEKVECLEQLRWLENNYKIKTAITTIETFGIDTPEDLEKVK